MIFNAFGRTLVVALAQWEQPVFRARWDARHPWINAYVRVGYYSLGFTYVGKE